MAITLPDPKPELSKYEIAEQIGHGGMATVYRARDRRLGRDVAVKLIHPHLRESPEVATRFVSEARAVAMLKHKNIVEVYDISDEAEAERYLVVELVRGPTLRELLREHGALPPEVGGSLVLEVAAALSHAHQLGIIHRDVKPENVLLEPPHRASEPGPASFGEARHTAVKLTDFGIAKLLDAQGVTSTGQVLGSPAHMAPEQIEGGEIGPRADVFGLGVLLYEAMVGALPFDGKNPAQVLRRVLDGTFTVADRVRPEVGARYAAIATRALQREAGDRFVSVEEMAEALRKELARVGVEDTVAELDRYFADPDGYAEEHRSRIVEALVDCGERARASGDIALASAQFNRALAYRPGNPELLRRVSALSRGERLRSAGKVALAAAAVVALGATAVTFWPAPPKAMPRPVPPKITPKAEPRTAPARPALSASAKPEQASPKRFPNRSSALAPTTKAPKQGGELAGGTRDVRVKVVGGVQGGTLYVDGAKKEWFGPQTLNLPLGPHVFAFQPSKPECCTAKPESIIIEEPKEGEGAQVVTLTVALKDAGLLFEPSLGPGKVECGLFFQGARRVPDVREVRVPMSGLDKSGMCSFFPDNTASKQIDRQVTLSAGQTTTFP